MKDWFDSLDARERQFVGIGAVVAVISLLYGLGWAPLEKKVTALKADAENWERSLAELRPLRAAAGNGQISVSTSSAGSQQSPIIIVDQTLRSRGLDRYRQRSQPTGSNGIRVEFENVAFDELVLWLGDLGDQYSMHVQSGSFSVGPQVSPGRVNASVTLERAL